MHVQLPPKAIAVTVAAGLLFTVSVPTQPTQPVQAQGQAPFLTTPYYGHKAINPFFDHEYPYYGTNQIFTRYDGSRWTNMSGCTLGVNCYDGHNGYDFAMWYESVLAAADGTVTTSGWYVPNCRDFRRERGYGLRAEINHGNGYITRYGHLSAVMTQGQHVTAGQAIGTSGNTGYSSGEHLHFDVRDTSGNQFDPFGWRGSGADPNSPASWCMWKSGEWANLCGGISQPVPELIDGQVQIIDDLDYNFSKSCAAGYPCPDWYAANIGHNSHMWWTYVNGTTPDYWAKWTPNLLRPGLYEIFVNVPCNNATTWQALYNVATPSGWGSAYVDQYGLCDRWVSIGSYPFRQGYNPDYYVWVTDATGEESQHCSGTCRLGIDAIKLVRRGRSTYVPITMRP
ncbi:MAG: peptidoglycan DD-metalloendopeptidase family protein [Chloroflexi bacterium]|nr:peptidoglycan DD-metalloendopeptidase family protein [Chloroflexota bacterium]